MCDDKLTSLSNIVVFDADDLLGRPLVRVDVQGNKEKYYYDGGLARLLVKEKPSGHGSWRTRRVYQVKPQTVSQVVGEATATSWSGSTPASWSKEYFVYDLTGNVVVSASSGGVAALARDGYGEAVPGALGAWTASGLGLTGKFRDPDTGLVWFGARWYEPETGTWLEPEPTGQGGPNLYHFGFGQSIVLGYDPDGELWRKIGGFGKWLGGAVGGVVGTGFGAATGEIMGLSLCGPYSLWTGDGQFFGSCMCNMVFGFTGAGATVGTVTGTVVGSVANPVEALGTALGWLRDTVGKVPSHPVRGVPTLSDPSVVTTPAAVAGIVGSGLGTVFATSNCK